MSSAGKPRVLCVAADPQLLAGMALHLGGEYDLHIASSGEEALERLSRAGGMAVVLTDMKMRGLGATALLEAVRASWPDATRIGLSSRADATRAQGALNEGWLSQLLIKPCTYGELRQAIAAGVHQSRLRCADQRTLQDTLDGCIAALVHTLAVTNPLAYDRAKRIQRMVVDFADQLGYRGFWQLETAALLSQYGQVGPGPEKVGKLFRGARLTAQEQVVASAEAHHVAVKLFDRIPQLEPVLRILTAHTWNDAQVARLGDGLIGVATRILGLILEYDSLRNQGYSVDVALRSLHDRRARFPDELVTHFSSYLARRPESTHVALGVRSGCPDGCTATEVSTRALASFKEPNARPMPTVSLRPKDCKISSRAT